MTVKELIEKLQGAVTGTSQDLAGVKVNGFPVLRVDVKNHTINIIADDGEEHYES